MKIQHKIILMEFKGILEAVGLTLTEEISSDFRKIMLQGGDPILPTSALSQYAKEATAYSETALELKNSFIGKSVKEARAFCKKNKIRYSTTKD